MKTFKQYLSEESEIFYRGLGQPWSDSYAEAQHIIFVTSDKDYALTYAKDAEHLAAFYIRTEKPFEFGFRTLTVEVKLDEILSRIKSGIIKQFESGKITKEIGRDLLIDLQKLNIPGHKKVWEWYMQVPELIKILKCAGFDSIKCNEGVSNNITTFGLFSSSQMTKIKA